MTSHLANFVLAVCIHSCNIKNNGRRRQTFSARVILKSMGADKSLAPPD